MFWEPVDALVLLKHQRLTALNIKEPAWNCAIHNALLAAWVKWILVLNILNLPDDAFFFKALRDKLVGRPDFKTILVGVTDANFVQFLCPLWEIVAIIVNRMASRNLILATKRKVILTVSWRNMDNARTVFSADEICRPNLVGVLIVCDLVVHRKEWLIFLAGEFFAFKGLFRLAIRVAKHLLGELRRKNYLLAIKLIEAIFELIGDSECHVCRKRPRRRRPSHNIFIRISDFK